MNARRLRWAMNVWPPYLFSGIRVTHIAEDFRHARVELRQRWYNRNYVGTHFGGSMFSMADPFFMIMFTRVLGREYTTWDKAASIEFKKPGTGTLLAEFVITQEMLEKIYKATSKEGDKIEPEFKVELKNSDGETVAIVSKTMHIRRKRDNRSHVGS